MREIEVKARVRNPDELMKELEARDCVFSDEILQEDINFVSNPGSSVEEYLENNHFLRLRTLDGGKTILTAKYNPKRIQFGDTMVTEHETEVASKDETRNIIELLGFSEAGRIVKRRRTGHLGDFEICLDEVKELGTFIEIERCVADESKEKEITDSMHAFLAELGISEEDKQVKRYDLQMLDLKYGTS